ncbi:LysR family transcriptional regulator [Paraburkholderia sediminicola]|uniref:LysR family transcriptional regulator n=1 Tax=Paraburkholderia sediminicola TaxID=458836 RepID=UPI0038B918D8
MALSPLPPLACLQAFEASARYLSFTRAGQELHLSTSAVSRQISQLEEFLGRRLFVREHNQDHGIGRCRFAQRPHHQHAVFGG